MKKLILLLLSTLFPMVIRGMCHEYYDEHPLKKSIAIQDLKEIKKHLKEIKKLEKWKSTRILTHALIDAASQGSLPITCLLLDNGASPLAHTGDALYYASAQANKEIMRTLITEMLKLKIQLQNTEYFYGSCNMEDMRYHGIDFMLSRAFFHACEEENISMMNELLPYVDIKNSPHQFLHTACSLGCYHSIRFLLAHGADIDQFLTLHTRESHTPLSCCIQVGGKSCVELLLEKGADVHAQDELALKEALRTKNFGIASLLLKYGANPHNLSLEEQKMLSKVEGDSLEEKSKEDDENLCSICYGDFSASDRRILPCGHIFHTDCIRQWFHHGDTCPICRDDTHV